MNIIHNDACMAEIVPIVHIKFFKLVKLSTHHHNSCQDTAKTLI